MSNIDLLLINPGGRETIYQGLGDILTGIEQPLWCRLIAGYCRDLGYSVQILDAEALNMTVDQVVKHISLINPGLIGVIVFGHQPNASTQQMDSASKICRAIKSSCDISIVIAGGHVSALPERTLKEESVDYVIKGEGPHAIASLLKGWTEPGIIQDAVQLDLDQHLHGNVWDLLPMGVYRSHNWQCFDGSQRQPYASIYTSLNCPYACRFCCISSPFGGPGYRTRDPSEVVKEIDHLNREYGVTTFKIIDEMFVLKQSHYLTICDGLSGLSCADDLNIWAYARVDTIKPETLVKLRKGGIRWLCLGIESGSSYVRDGSRKTIDDNDIRESVKAIQKAGINVLGNFIFGLPDDTLESMRATLELAKSLECEYSNFYSAMGYPGSKLHTEIDPKDLPKSWAGYSQHSRETTPLPTNTVSSMGVLKFRDEAFNEYFSDPNYIDLVRSKFGEHAVKEIELMTSHKMERNLLV